MCLKKNLNNVHLYSSFLEREKEDTTAGTGNLSLKQPGLIYSRAKHYSHYRNLIVFNTLHRLRLPVFVKLHATDPPS